MDPEDKTDLVDEQNDRGHYGNSYDLSLGLMDGPWSPCSQSDSPVVEDDKIKNWKAAGKAVRKMLSQVNAQQLAQEKDVPLTSLSSEEMVSSGNSLDKDCNSKCINTAGLDDHASRSQYFPSMDMYSTTDAMNEMLDEFKANQYSNDKISSNETKSGLENKISVKENGGNIQSNNYNVLKPSRTLNDLSCLSNLNCHSSPFIYTERLSHSSSSTELSRMNDSSDTRCSYDSVVAPSMISNVDDESCDLERSHTLLEASFNDIQMDAVVDDKSDIRSNFFVNCPSINNENNAHYLYGRQLDQPENHNKYSFNSSFGCPQSEHGISNKSCEHESKHEGLLYENISSPKQYQDTDMKWQELKEKIARLTGKTETVFHPAQKEDDESKCVINQADLSDVKFEGKKSSKVRTTTRNDCQLTMKRNTASGSSDSDDVIQNRPGSKSRRYSEHRKRCCKIRDKVATSLEVSTDHGLINFCASNSVELEGDSRLLERITNTSGGDDTMDKTYLPEMSILHFNSTSHFGNISHLKRRKDSNEIPSSLLDRENYRHISASANVLLKLNDDRIETLKSMMYGLPPTSSPKNCDISSTAITKNSIVYPVAQKKTLCKSAKTEPCSSLAGTHKDSQKDCDKINDRLNLKIEEKQLLSDLTKKTELLLSSNTHRLTGIRNCSNSKVPFMSTKSSPLQPVLENSNTNIASPAARSSHTATDVSGNSFGPCPSACRLAGTDRSHPFYEAIMRNCFPPTRNSPKNENETSNNVDINGKQMKDQCDDLTNCDISNDNIDIFECDCESSSDHTDEEDNTEPDSMPDLISSSDEPPQLEKEHYGKEAASHMSNQHDNSDQKLQDSMPELISSSDEEPQLESEQQYGKEAASPMSDQHDNSYQRFLETCESDYGEDFTDLHISSNIPSDEEEEAVITISPRDIDSLPELHFSSESESGSEADDEFECDCSVCVTSNEGIEIQDSSTSIHEYSNDVSAQFMERLEDEDLTSNHNSSANSENQTEFESFPFLPFSIRLSELSPFDLLITRQSRRDLLEVMFQNVFMQMLAVHPELLNDRAPPPLNSEDLTSIPVINIDETQLAKEAKCPICLCEFVEGEEARKLQCTHTFHTLCIEAWFAKSGTCPVCRDVIIPAQDLQ